MNILQTKNKSIETIYFSKILSMDPLLIHRLILHTNNNFSQLKCVLNQSIHI